LSLNFTFQSMYKDMTFTWTEMYFLSMWWDQASADQKSKLENLIREGRFEILTGGWVMTDEANVHIYAMLDQLIEGWLTIIVVTNTHNYI